MEKVMDLYGTGGSVTLAICLVILYALFRLLKRSGPPLPPGPRGLPIVGYLPFMTKRPHLKLIQLAKKYGPVFGLKLGNRNVVAVCDFKSLREANGQDAFMGTPRETPFILHKETIEQEVFSGVKWKEQKRFSLQLLRDLGFAKSSMEDNIKEEICFVLDYMEKHSGQPILTQPLLAPSTSNNISSLLFGRRMKYDDPMRIKLDRILKDVGNFTDQMFLVLFFPWAKPILQLFRGHKFKALEKVTQELMDFISDEVKEHEKTLDPDNIRDFIDGYLVQIDKKKADPDTTFIKPVLEDLSQGFFGAGSDTVRIAVDWLIRASSAFPDIQRKVQAEIDNVIGTERFPKYTDHTNMPYTEAVIMESLRWRTILPINFLKVALKDTQINSFPIAKGTYVLGNLWAVHNDPSLWRDPDTFRPERFLTDDGKGVKKSEYLIPFSIGKRSCPGETFATIEIFLYYTAILQKFNIRLPEGAVLDLEGDLGLALLPKPQEIIFELRH